MRICICLFVTLSALALQVHAEPISLPTIEVVAEDGDDQRHTANVSSYSQQDIKQLGSISVTEFLSNQGILQVRNQSSMQNQSGISLRGFGDNASANSLILIDGIPLTSFSHIGPDLNSLLIENIERIDVIPGSFGVLYGDQAVGGVVNIITKVPDQENRRLSLAAGNQQQALGEGFWSSPINQQWSASLGVMGYHSDHYQAHNRQNNYNINGMAVHRGSSHKTTIGVFSYQTDIEIPQSLLYLQTTPIINSLNYSETTTHMAYLNDVWLLSSDLTLSNGLAFESSNSRGRVNVLFTSGQSNLLWHGEWQYQAWLAGGYDLQRQNYDLQNSLQNNRVEATVGDLFARATLPLSDDMHLTLGLRSAHQYLTGSTVTLSQAQRSNSHVLVDEEGLQWQLSKDLQWYIRRDTNYRFAKASEKVWVSDNLQDLQTQTGVSYESGLRWSRAGDKVSLSVYRLYLDNEIAFDPEPTAGAPFGKMYNLPPTARTGGELTWEHRLRSQPMSLSWQNSVVDARFTQGIYRNKKVPSVSPLKSTWGLRYFGWEHWELSVSEVYNSGFYAAYDLLNQGAKFSGYFLTNVYIQRHWSAWSLSLQINNLFDEHYARYGSYFAGPVAITRYYPDDGINALLKVTWRAAE